MLGQKFGFCEGVKFGGVDGYVEWEALGVVDGSVEVEKACELGNALDTAEGFKVESDTV